MTTAVKDSFSETLDFEQRIWTERFRPLVCEVFADFRRVEGKEGFIKPFDFSGSVRASGERKSVEMKSEKTKTGNLFLEVWSNGDFDSRRPGWMQTCKADWLWYYFESIDVLYTLNFRALVDWCFHVRSKGYLWWYSNVEQKKYRQKNLTVGKLVKIETLMSRKEIEMKALPWSAEKNNFMGFEEQPVQLVY